MIRIGIIREGKVPQDARVPLTPKQAAALAAEPDVDVVVQASPHRCYRDEEYKALGLRLVEDVSDRDILLGVKEVPIPELQAGKTHFFFSHTIKAQPYNRGLLRAVLAQDIRLVDWETLTDDAGKRVIAFGRWAGIVGAHNALWSWGIRTGTYSLDRAMESHDYAALRAVYGATTFPSFRAVVTGGGRVAQGAWELLDAAGIRRISPADFLAGSYASEPVYTTLDCPELYARRSDGGFEWSEFFDQPSAYEGRFAPYAKAADIMINAVYWDPAAPVFFTRDEMADPGFRIRGIADITCDIEGSVPSTVRATTIADPLYGWELDRQTEIEAVSGDRVVTVMSIDNLPNELPRDASEAFGEQFVSQVWPSLKRGVSDPMIDRASIAVDGLLNTPYAYLADYVKD